MKKVTSAVLVLLSVMVFSCTTQTTAQKTTGPESEDIAGVLKQMPAAKAGFQRMVITLPKKADQQQEENYQVQILPGKVMQVDCNRHNLQGNLVEKELSGFGYPYYEFSSDGNTASTMMACPDNKKQEELVYGETKMLRYNSRVPIVVYVPEGFELRYKIWQSGASLKASSK